MSSSKHTNLNEAQKRNIELFGSAPSFRSSSRGDKRGRSSRGSSRDSRGKEKKRGGLSSFEDGNEKSGRENIKDNPYGRCPNVSLRYEKLDRIGEGTYGVVYRARDKQTQDIVALKRCLPHHEASDGFPLTTLREINMLRELNAADDDKKRGIVQLKDVAVSSSRSGVFLVFEYCEHDLANLIDSHYSVHKRSPFIESQVKRLSIQLLSALSFLHSRYVLHRDVKLSNLLYNHKGELRLADFGLCRRMGGRIKRDNHPKCCGDSDDDSDEERARACFRHARPASPTTILTPNVVSLWYRPPELLLGAETYDEGVDNWGAGCVIAELFKGVPLIKGKNEMEQLRLMWDILGVPNLRDWPALNEMPLIKNKSISLPQQRTYAPSSSSSPSSLPSRFRNLSSSGVGLLSNLLEYNPSVRWTAQEALNSPYFREMPMPTNHSLMPTFPTQHGK